MPFAHQAAPSTANLLTSLGIDETLLRTDAAGPRSFLPDGLGSTLVITDSVGLVQSQYTYEPFGKTTASGVASANAFKYTGREDDGTGLYYYRARYYHPALQRFISEDPIGLTKDTSKLSGFVNAGFPEFEGDDTGIYGYVGGRIDFADIDFNLYGYVSNDPLNFVDPQGTIRLPPAITRVLKNFKFDGPSAGFRAHGQGRVCQVRYKNQPIFRLDYDPIPGSGGAPRLHYHRAPDMRKHRPYEGY